MSLTEEQLRLRRTGIGASEIASVCGLNRYGSPHTVWEAKMGLPGPEASEYLELLAETGQRLEPVIAAWHSDRHGVSLQHLGDRTLRHPEVEWMIATLDYGRVADEVLVYPVEVKTADVYTAKDWGEEDTDQIPSKFIVQVQQQMAVVKALGLMPDVEEAHIAVLVGRFLKRYIVPFDLEIVEMITEVGGRFWRDNVVGEVPPLIDPSKPCRGFLGRRFPEDDGVMAVAMPADLPWADQYERAHAEAKKAEALLDEAENHLIGSIGDSTGIAGTFGKYTWKTQVGRVSPWAWAKALKAQMIEAGLVPVDQEDFRGDPTRVFRRGQKNQAREES